jgi:iron complex outermembrane receptor protein
MVWVNPYRRSFLKAKLPDLYRWGRAGFLILLAAGSATVAAASYAGDLTALSIEELMAIEFSTLGRKSQRLTDTPAAAFVITAEDIRRSGATSVPEALRMVSGIQVARIGADKWAISSRGFNDWFSNKLLVLMDGRTVYNSVYSGVYWRDQDVLLEDVARIEVIRGPGASLWGANAVNGVINIVTKPAIDTQGALVTAGAGTEERAFGAARYGGALGSSAHYSAYVKHADHDDTATPADESSQDAYYLSHGGGRIDWQAAKHDGFTLQGDYRTGRAHSRAYIPTLDPSLFEVTQNSNDLGGSNLLGRWRHTFSATSDLAVQAYYDRSDSEFAIYAEEVDTYDLDLQHRFALGGRQEILWGLGYRLTRGEVESTPILSFDPAERTDDLFSLFVQDEIALMPKKLALILGSKFEENDFTGWETQPNVRLRWTPYDRHTFWTAVSMAVRTPSRYERDVQLTHIELDDTTPGIQTAIIGNDDFESEELTAYEAGYRFLGERWGFDLAFFYNRYDRLRTWEPGTPYIEGSPPYVVIPLYTVNEMQGKTYGAEAAMDWRPLGWWRLQGAYGCLQMDLNDPVTDDLVSDEVEGQNPEQQASLRSSMDFSHGFELDLWLKYVDDLRAYYQQVPAYWELDARLGWQATQNWSFDLVGQNLLNDHHPEFSAELLGVPRAEIERGMYFKATWRFQ